MQFVNLRNEESVCSYTQQLKINKKSIHISLFMTLPKAIYFTGLKYLFRVFTYLYLR